MAPILLHFTKLLPSDGSDIVAYLRSCYLAMAVVSLLVSLSVPSTWCTCHNNHRCENMTQRMDLFQFRTQRTLHKSGHGKNENRELLNNDMGEGLPVFPP
jgi:hypothetical protein